jgi:isopropylmalate/homocitrate/citramalate synthase
MFTFQSTLDQVVKGSKQVLSYVQDKGLRSNLESVVDAQAEFATTLFHTNLDLAKMVVEQLGTNEYTKPLAEVAKKAVAEVK